MEILNILQLIDILIQTCKIPTYKPTILTITSTTNIALNFLIQNEHKSVHY